MKYVVTYHAAEGAGDQLREHFPAHRAWFTGFAERGLLLMIGPFTDEPAGDALAVFTTRAAAEEFVHGDPFLRNGLIASWSVREWREALIS
jgi:uncharacterized protein YciI